MKVSIYNSGIQTIQNIHKFRMYWIFIPSIVIWLIYLFAIWQSQPYFDLLHAFDHISIFGWELELESYISSVEWFYFFLLLEIFKFVILSLLSPFNAYISEIYDQKLTGDDFKFSFWRMLEDFLRGIIISITGFSLEMLVTGFWLVLNLFFPLDGLTPVVFLLISSFFFGFAYFDYSLERHEYGVAESWQYAFQFMGRCFSVGLLFSLIMYIPHAGIIIAPPLITLFATHHFISKKASKSTPKPLK